jgi:hypothetical protein
MSTPRNAEGESGEVSIPEDPSDEAREQLKENDELLREGDVPTPDVTVPTDDEEQREKREEDEQADHLLHDGDMHDPSIEP